MSNYLITVNEEELEFKTSDADSLDSIAVNAQTLHVLDNNTAFKVEIRHADYLNKTISLFPFPKTKRVFSKGLKYPLNGMNLNMKKNQIGIRNEAILDEIEICYETGDLLVFVGN